VSANVSSFTWKRKRRKIYLFEVDGGLPEVVALEVEISHTNLTEVTGVVLVEVGSVMVLSHSSAFPLSYLNGKTRRT
jgi:hypothetical protein